ncbi:MAG: hypothetical protein RLZZ91_593 [Bacteroidota bacterium]|jgi:hypothetical protein
MRSFLTFAFILFSFYVEGQFLSAPGTYIHSRNASNTSNRETVIWSEDFANGIPTNWNNSGAPALAIWEYRGPSTNPNQLVGSRGSCLPDGTIGEAIASTTSANGFIIFDSNYWDNDANPCTVENFGSGQAPGPHLSYLTTAPIDLSGFPNAVLEFEQYIRYYLGNTRVEISIANGPWETLYANFLDQGITTTNTQIVRMPLPAFAGNQSNIQLRFVYDGLYYFWQIDDIRILQGYANDLLIENSSYGDFDLNNPDHTTGFEMMEYTQYPSAFAPLVHLNSNVFNFGTNTQTNIALNARIMDDNSGALLYENASPTLPSLAPGADSVLVSGEFQMEQVVADYSVYFNSLQNETDENTENSLDTLHFKITSFTYARDENSLGSMFLPSEAFANAPFEMGAVYLLPSGQQLHSVSVAMGEGTTLPCSVYATVFPFSLSTGIGGAIASTQDIAVTEADINSFGEASMKVLSFDSPVFLSQGLYLVVVGSSSSAFQAVIGLSGKSEDLSAWVRFNNSNTDLFYLTRTPMIRMNFGPVSNITEQSFGQSFQIFPNPTTESLSILLNEKETATIEVFDETGRRMHMQKTNTEVSKIEMNVSEFSSGIYTVRVTQANHASAQIFIKQ